MKRPILLAFFVLAVVSSVAAQVSNETLQNRITSAQATKIFTVTHDAAASTSKLMAVSDNVSRDEANRAGILAMNFAIGHFYAGDALTKEPDSFLLTFWVLTKKPRFGANHAMTVALREEMLVIGSARYVAKPAQQMEYLNFEISRENLVKIAGQSDVRFMLGDEEFTFTKSQMRLLADLLTITALGNESGK